MELFQERGKFIAHLFGVQAFIVICVGEMSIYSHVHDVLNNIVLIFDLEILVCTCTCNCGDAL